ncbi:D-alanine--D-alanine ligase [Flavobacterium sp.]|uniref:D-alanine--D-alanine ligase n=1 Tax=Flavobacterium sp. TaxID=239 RepID=UPI0039E48AEB
MRLFFHKLTHWEYWPFKLVYVPIYFQWAFYALRSGSIFFFNACNPSIKNGGFINESKKKIYDLMPPEHYPKTELVRWGDSIDAVLQTIGIAKIQYPFIVKPDIGLRGSAVKKINNETQLKTYHRKADFDYLLQDLIPYANEVGIFYVRYPNQPKGKITGIVAKEFLIVTGDGQSTLEDLIRKDPRYEIQFQALQREYGNRLDEIPKIGEKVNLVPYGNHARGAKFTDGSHWNSPALENVINQICLQVPDFYFGRLDLMYDNWQDLEQGNNFSIVELNGAASEPTHIYDPKHSIFFAWKELSRHIRYMYEISVMNHKNGAPYLSHKTGMAEYRLHQAQCDKIFDF